MIALVVAGAVALFGALDEDGSPPPPGAAAQGGVDSGRVVDRVRPGLALVTATRGSEGRSGSAFMVDSTGVIVTARHLVAGASTIEVRAEGASGPIRAELLGSDPSTDLAVLKIPGDDARSLQPLRLTADEDGVRMGEPVVAVGTPFGLGGTVTAGVVSGLDRQVRTGGATIDGVIHTDAGVGDGNVGGPLVDDGGDVVGVNLAGSGSGGYAIPVDTVREVVESVESDGDLDVPYIGMAAVPLTPGLAELLGLQVEHGLLVRSVVPGGPADMAGLRGARPGRPAGDVVIAIDGEGVRRPRDAQRAVLDRKPGDRVEVRVVRRGREVRLRLRLGRY